MVNLLWLLVVLLIIAWILGLAKVFAIAATFIWILLIAAVVLAVLAFLTGGYMR